MTVEPEAYLEHLRRDADALAAAVETDPSAEVPSMPGYDAGALLIHTGAVYSWFLACMAGDSRADPEALEPPGVDYLRWYRHQLDQLLATLRERGPDSPTWTWGSCQATGFWYRRAAHETAMHRWDAQNALGAAEPIDAELAVDGIDEMLDEMLDEAGEVSGSGEIIHIHATDAPGEWLIVVDDAGLRVTREHGKGDVAARGPASDLLLMLYSRLPVSAVEAFGDVGLLERWQRDVSI